MFSHFIYLSFRFLLVSFSFLGVLVKLSPVVLHDVVVTSLLFFLDSSHFSAIFVGVSKTARFCDVYFVFQNVGS